MAQFPSEVPAQELSFDLLSEDQERFFHYHQLSNMIIPPLHACLDSWLSPIETPQKEIIQAARYALFSGGKRVRPLLLGATIAASFPQREDPAKIAGVIEVAAVIELIHTYSLIHDDLPCMDNDDYRRGRKTLHKIIGEGLALLVGDFLLTLAFEKLAAISSIDAALRCRLVEMIARSCGHQGMVGGQYLDLTAHQHPHTKELLTWIHRKKTGSLFTCSILSGALLAGCESEQLAKWEALSQDLGLLFQLIDDLLDAMPSNNTTRIPLGPSSYIAMSGSESAWDEALELRRQIFLQLEQLTSSQQSAKKAFEEMVELICAQYKQQPVT